jgi:hypothetical protein
MGMGMGTYIFPTPLYTFVSLGRASISAVESSSMRFLRVCEASCWRTSTSCCEENWALLSISWRSCWSFSLGIAIFLVRLGWGVVFCLLD